MARVRAAFTSILEEFPSVALEELDAGGAGH